jgi:hypothetical protein
MLDAVTLVTPMISWIVAISKMQISPQGSQTTTLKILGRASCI